MRLPLFLSKDGGEELMSIVVAPSSSGPVGRGVYSGEQAGGERRAVGNNHARVIDEMGGEGAIWRIKRNALLLIFQVFTTLLHRPFRVCQQRLTKGFRVRSQSGFLAILTGLLVLVNQRRFGLSILDFIDWWSAEFTPAQHNNRSNSTRDKPVPQPFTVTRKNILHGAVY